MQRAACRGLLHHHFRGNSTIRASRLDERGIMIIIITRWRRSTLQLHVSIIGLFGELTTAEWLFRATGEDVERVPSAQLFLFHSKSKLTKRIKEQQRLRRLSVRLRFKLCQRISFKTIIVYILKLQQQQQQHDSSGHYCAISSDECSYQLVLVTHMSAPLRRTMDPRRIKIRIFLFRACQSCECRKAAEEWSRRWRVAPDVLARRA